MASDCSDSATGILTQLIGVCETSSDELDDDSISIISSSSGSSSTSTSKEAPGSSGTETVDSISNNASPLLLLVLQQANSSDLCRKRVIRNNFPLKGKKWKVSTTLSSSIKSVSPKDRWLTDYPQIQIHLSSVQPCPSSLPQDSFWYGRKDLD